MWGDGETKAQGMGKVLEVGQQVSFTLSVQDVTDDMGTPLSSESQES